MEAKVLIVFRDKKEGVTRNKGDTFTLTKERFAEINANLTLVAEVKSKKQSKK